MTKLLCLEKMMLNVLTDWKTLKDAASGKIFDLMNDFGETEMPEGQRICKVFGVD